MSSGVEGTPPRGRSRSGTWFTGGAVALACLLLVGFAVPGATAAPTWAPDPVAWSNGLVLCNFAPSSPSVAVSHLNVANTGMSVSLLGLSEVRPNGTTAATAELSGFAWVVRNLSNPDAYDLAYLAQINLSGTSGAPGPVGSVDLGVQFVLPAYQGSPDGSTDTVNVVMSAANWTWQAADDHLALSFGVSSAFPATEHLVEASGTGWIVSSTSNSSGLALEQMGTDGTGNATTLAGSTSAVAAASSLSLSSPAQAAVNVVFAPAGEITSLAFASHVRVVLPTSVAGIPLSELAAAGAAGVAVSVAVAAISRRLRRKPSPLIFVDEEARP